MRVWDYAYRAYRKGDYWQQLARDHERFRNRTLKLENIINPILEKGHRDKIYLERFNNIDDSFNKMPPKTNSLLF